MEKNSINIAANAVQKSDHGSSVEEHLNKSSTILPQSPAKGDEFAGDAVKTIQKEGAEACKVDTELHDHKH